jgi:cytochrome P450
VKESLRATPEPVVFDPSDDRYTADPYPVLAELRAAGPVRRVRQLNGLEYWLVTRYEEARAVLGDQRFSKDLRRHASPTLREFGIGSS